MKSTKLFQSNFNFRDVFHLPKGENSPIVWGGLFSLNVCEATSKDARALQAASATNRRKFWRETRTLLWRDKTSFAILIGCIVAFTCRKHRSLRWLPRTLLVWKLRCSFSVSISQVRILKNIYSPQWNIGKGSINTQYSTIQVNDLMGITFVSLWLWWRIAGGNLKAGNQNR